MKTRRFYVSKFRLIYNFCVANHITFVFVEYDDYVEVTLRENDWLEVMEYYIDLADPFYEP